MISKGKRAIVFIIILVTGVASGFYLLSRPSTIDLLVKIQFVGSRVEARTVTFGAVATSSHNQPFACVPRGQRVSHTYNLGASETLAGTPEKITNVWISVADVPWNSNDLQIYDGGNKLIAIPDDISFEVHGKSSCSVDFMFRGFKPPNAPIIIKPSSNDYGVWKISQTEVKTKVVTLSPGDVRW